MDPPLSSSRACLHTAFIAFSVHCMFGLATWDSAGSVCFSCPSLGWARDKGLLVLGFITRSRRGYTPSWVVASFRVSSRLRGVCHCPRVPLSVTPTPQTPYPLIPPAPHFPLPIHFTPHASLLPPPPLPNPRTTHYFPLTPTHAVAPPPWHYPPPTYPPPQPPGHACITGLAPSKPSGAVYYTLPHTAYKIHSGPPRI